MNEVNLEQALRRDLHALVSDIFPSQSLVARVLPERRSRRPRIRRRPSPSKLSLLVAAPVAIAGVVAAVIGVLSGPAAPPAFAVTVDHGSVWVTVNQIAGIGGADARLEALGIPVRVVPMTAACSSQVAMSYLGMSTSNPMVKLTPATIPAGTTVVLAARSTGPGTVALAVGRVTGAVPPCVSSRGTGPGLPGWTGPAREPATGGSD